MEKVKLPRRVAEALEKARKWADIHNVSADFVAWCIPQADMAKDHGEYWKTLYDFGNNGGFLKLIDALRYGYDIEPEPITVTITPEQQKEIWGYYKAHVDMDTVEGRANADIIYRTLEFAGITIPGVNA